MQREDMDHIETITGSIIRS